MQDLSMLRMIFLGKVFQHLFCKPHGAATWWAGEVGLGREKGSSLDLIPFKRALRPCQESTTDLPRRDNLGEPLKSSNLICCFLRRPSVTSASLSTPQKPHRKSTGLVGRWACAQTNSPVTQKLCDLRETPYQQWTSGSPAVKKWDHSNQVNAYAEESTNKKHALRCSGSASHHSVMINIPNHIHMYSCSNVLRILWVPKSAIDAIASKSIRSNIEINTAKTTPTSHLNLNLVTHFFFLLSSPVAISLVTFGTV